MPSKELFSSTLDISYQFSGKSIILGAAIFNGEVLTHHLVNVPLQTINRHGLIAGATGTGKTKSLQLLAEGLSDNGVPVLLMDIKGDLSGLAKEGTVNPKVMERMAKIGIDWKASGYPVELFSLSEQPGIRLRATVSEFGPVLFAKILELNNVQQGLLAMIFKYADDKQLPLLDLQDLKALIQFVSDEGKQEIKKTYGAISTASSGTILRKIIELEQQGASVFFGEPSFDPHDLLRTDSSGRGYINIIRLTDLQSKPKLFSTFMLQLLAEIFSSFPEEGDAEKPKLVIFCDEAHLIFNEASKQLLNEIDTTIKLIRSKGIGIIFCTQNPQDIPASVLSQLGLKIQHALRAFTAADRKAIKLAAENFPSSEFYKINDLITQLGIGEALVTALNEQGTPTMLVHTLMSSPSSRMDILTDSEIQQNISGSKLTGIYNQPIDRQSAFELLQKRMNLMHDDEDSGNSTPATKQNKAELNTFDKILKSPLTRSIGVTVAGMVTRTLLGSLGLKSRSTSGRRQ
ncbi:MAG: DUF853 family protein [Chitinophagales bacterium]|nr:DUF853 family protein [Chitinophagales bacterium]